MSQLNPDVYPIDLNIFRDEEGRNHIYKFDPLKPESAATEIKNLDSFCDQMYIYMGTMGGTKKNPVQVRLKLYKMNRTTNFSPDVLARVLKLGDMHIMDKDGNIVSMSPFLNNNARYPYSGTVFNTEGTVIEQRSYSIHGECADGDEEHNLYVVAGPAPLKTVQ